MEVGGELRRQNEAHRARLARLRGPTEPTRIRPLAPAIEQVAKKPKARKIEPIDATEYWPQMWMWDLIEFRPKGPPPIKTIIEITAKHFGISMNELISARRLAFVCRARHIAMYLCREYTLKSLPEIGRRIGDRDHTTVLHAVRKIVRRIGSDPELRTDILEVSRKLGF